MRGGPGEAGHRRPGGVSVESGWGQPCGGLWAELGKVLGQGGRREGVGGEGRVGSWWGAAIGGGATMGRVGAGEGGREGRSGYGGEGKGGGGGSIGFGGGRGVVRMND